MQAIIDYLNRTPPIDRELRSKEKRIAQLEDALRLLLKAKPDDYVARLNALRVLGRK